MTELRHVTRGALRIRLADSAQDCDIARTLFVEYAKWLGVDLCFQSFNEELANLPGAYAPPAGRLFLADSGDGSEAGGCVALRRLNSDPSETACELKRLWVRPAFRGHDAGRLLTEAALSAAREIGYTTIKLDTIPAIMPHAVGLYRSLGFTDCAPYYQSQIPDSLYMERVL